MKKFYFLGLIMFSVVFLNATIVEKTYYFESPVIIPTGEFQMIYLENALITGKTGEPALPYQAVRLLLPPGEKAVSIECIGSDEVLLSGVFNIYPQQSSRPLSQPGNGSFSQNELVYQTNAFYPSTPTGHLTTQYLNGYALTLSTFTPVRFNPVTGEVIIFTKVLVKVVTEPDSQSLTALDNLKSTETSVKKIKSFAQNPEMISQYPSISKSLDDYKLLILTPSQYAGNFQGLIDAYLARGIKSQVVTRETINTTGTGQDLAEKIRNYIIQEYQEHSVEYVLLGGDVEYVPYRGFYCYAQSGSGYEDNNIPADLYYSGLDGSWNTDGDNRWGEPGEDDLLPDIAVGRFSFSNEAELNNMLNKTISYQNNPVLGEFNNTLFAGEWLYGNPETWGSDYLELLIGFRDDNGYETWGIPETYNFQKLYEENQPWGANNLMTAINAGKQYVHHVGHANSNYVAYMSNSDITNGNFAGANGISHNYTIFHSHGCICGAFDDSDCIMEKMVSIANFAVAVIGNSRYGWFNEGQTEGPAAHLHREMMDAIYHEKMNHIGKAFSESKIQTAPWVTAPGQWEEGALRWNFYDINILGDPTLSVWTAEPISIQTTYDNVIQIGESSISVMVMGNGLPVENLTCTFLKDGILHGVSTTDVNGNAEVVFELPVNESGDAQLIVSGNNILPAAYPVSVVLATGENELNPLEFNVYPNPSKGNFTLQLPSNEKTSYSVVLLDCVGKEIKQLTKKSDLDAGNDQMNFSLTDVEAGIYFIRIKSDHSTMTKRLVLTK